MFDENYGGGVRIMKKGSNESQILAEAVKIKGARF